MKPLWSADDMAAWPKGSDEFVEAFAKGLGLLAVFEGETRGLTIAQAAQRTGLTRAGARRFLHTLRHLGLARLETDGRFLLTARVLRLGYSYLSSLDIAERARPVVDALSAQTGRTVALSVLDGAEVVFVARADTSRILRHRLVVGSRLPCFCTSMGRALLMDHNAADIAALLEPEPRPRFTPHTRTRIPDIAAAVAEGRRQGWVMVKEELELGACGIAAPIREPAGAIVAALNISVNLAGSDATDLTDHLLDRLLEAAGALSAGG